MGFLAPWSDQLLSVLRIVSALLFLQHGTQKLLQFPVGADGGGGTPEFLSLIWFAGAIELVGGILLTIGLWTRITALICAGEMAVAYFMAHAPQGFYPVLNGGELAIMFCFVFLYLAATGGGAWSIDAQLGRAKTSPAAA